MIGGLVGDLLGGAVGGSIGTRLYESGRRRRLARDDRAGRPLVIPGAILGTTSYCHPRGGVLEVDGAALAWLTGRGGLRYPVPVERLTVGDVTESSDAIASAGGWVDVHCTDGSERVTIVLPRHDLPYLARAMPGVTG